MERVLPDPLMGCWAVAYIYVCAHVVPTWYSQDTKIFAYPARIIIVRAPLTTIDLVRFRWCIG